MAKVVDGEIMEVGSELFAKFGSHDGESRTLLESLPRSLQERACLVNPRWLEMDEYQLEELVQPPPMLSRIRVVLHREHDRALASGKKFTLARVALGLGVSQATVRMWLWEPVKLLWCLHPPAAYEAILEESVVHGMQRLRSEILTMDIRGPDGGIDPKKGELLLKAISYVDLRLNGGIVQKTESREMRLVASARDMREIAKDVDARELDAKIRELEMKTERYGGTLPDVETGPQARGVLPPEVEEAVVEARVRAREWIKTEDAERVVFGKTFAEMQAEQGVSSVTDVSAPAGKSLHNPKAREYFEQRKSGVSGSENSADEE